MSVRYSPDSMRIHRSAARDAFRAYCREALLPALGASTSFRLRVPSDGLGSMVYFLEAPGLPPLVLRGDPRRWTLRRRILAHDRLIRHGLPAPEIRFHDLSPLTRLRWGYYFAVERRLPGEAFARRPDPVRTGRLFARIHGIQGALHGPVGARLALLRSLSDRRWLVRKARRWLSRYARTGCPDVARVKAWLRRWPRDAWFPPPRLTMGDVTPTNVLVADESVNLVDLSGVRFFSASVEVLRLHYRLLRGNESLWPTLLEAYLQEAAPTLRAEVERSLPLVQALQHVRVAAASGRAEAQENRLKRLFAILDNVAPR